MGWQQAGIYLTSRVTTGYDPRANLFVREAERSSALRRSSSPARANHGDGGRGGSGLPVRILPPPSDGSIRPAEFTGEGGGALHRYQARVRFRPSPISSARRVVAV